LKWKKSVEAVENGNGKRKEKEGYFGTYFQKLAGTRRT